MVRVKEDKTMPGALHMNGMDWTGLWSAQMITTMIVMIVILFFFLSLCLLICSICSVQKKRKEK